MALVNFALLQNQHTLADSQKIFKVDYIHEINTSSNAESYWTVLGDVMVSNVTFLCFLNSMLVAINIEINCSFCIYSICLKYHVGLLF